MSNGVEKVTITIELMGLRGSKILNTFCFICYNTKYINHLFTHISKGDLNENVVNEPTLRNINNYYFSSTDENF